MKFFDRKKGILKLREIRERSHKTSTFTVMTGRRRVGKTELVKQAFSDEPFVYLFVTRSAEADLCDGFKQRIEEFTGQTIPGKIFRFSDIFRHLFQLASERPITVVIDEFQDFFRVNPAIYSEIRGVVDGSQGVHAQEDDFSVGRGGLLLPERMENAHSPQIIRENP